MRYYPAALALSLLAGVWSSTGETAEPQPLDPRAAGLLTQGQLNLEAGRLDYAVDAYESALSIQPGSVTILLELAAATRKQGMQGKALHYYRLARMSMRFRVKARHWSKRAQSKRRGAIWLGCRGCAARVAPQRACLRRPLPRALRPKW